MRSRNIARMSHDNESAVRVFKALASASTQRTELKKQLVLMRALVIQSAELTAELRQVRNGNGKHSATARKHTIGKTPSK